MKIETLKSTDYTKGAQSLRLTVLAGSREEVTGTLCGKECLNVYADNTGEDLLVERLEGYRYLYSLDETGDGRFEVVLTREEPTLRMLALKAVSKIESHDRSSAVNSFTLGGRSMWLDKETRVGLVNSIGMEQAAGKETTVLWYDGQRYVIPIPLALQMLSCLELYALECYNVTQEHIAAVLALETREEVEGYDYTSGYPDKLVFNL